MDVVSGILEKIFSGRWIAGPEIDDALKMASRLNAKRIHVLINYLGEDFSEKSDVDQTTKKYVKLISEIKSRELNASVSVKPSQLGMHIGYELARGNYEKIVDAGRKNNVFVWLDMEEYGTVSQTIRLYLSRSKNGGTGICIQSYLKRSIADIKRLVKNNAVIRLVKGAYSAPAKYAYTSRESTTKNYEKLMRYLFDNAETFTIATHDNDMIKEAMTLNRARRRMVTYAFLNGIMNNHVVQLALSGNRISVYIPFGERWISYTYRRLKEAGHVGLVVKSLFRNQHI